MFNQMTYWEAAINEEIASLRERLGVRDLPTVLAHFGTVLASNRAPNRARVRLSARFASTGKTRRGLHQLARVVTVRQLTHALRPTAREAVIHAAAPSTVPGLALPEHRWSSAAAGKNGAA